MLVVDTGEEHYGNDKKAEGHRRREKENLQASIKTKKAPVNLCQF